MIYCCFLGSAKTAVGGNHLGKTTWDCLIIAERCFSGVAQLTTSSIRDGGKQSIVLCPALNHSFVVRALD